ncbi:hypothetical protein Pcinc_021569 [Petrolisthes cinctipes]|uniref:Uncharacterized protein n=1 Tax=Petrolisthes cinctipes TaxID=88211 RepID=A0AAE1FH53_PETCI|nr:hypothetical protein Pcinc_021569 [Petrolisthes cinctipes]
MGGSSRLHDVEDSNETCRQERVKARLERRVQRDENEEDEASSPGRVSLSMLGQQLLISFDLTSGKEDEDGIVHKEERKEGNITCGRVCDRRWCFLLD